MNLQPNNHVKDPCTTYGWQKAVIGSWNTDLDQIVPRLKCGCVPLNVLLLVTPARKDQNYYRLNVIDCVRRSVYRVTTITREELAQFVDNKYLQRYNFVIASQYLDIENMSKNSPVLKHVISSVNKRFCASQCSINESKCKFQAEKCFTNTSNSHKTREDELNIPRLVQLVNRINASMEPCATDLQHFFDLAHKYMFKIYIRPQLCLSTSMKLATALPHELPRFNLDCYMLFDCYVGSIILNLNHIIQHLCMHPELLENVNIITDVWNLTPLPKWFVASLRRVSTWTSMDFLYDMCGEYVFSVYKHFV